MDINAAIKPFLDIFTRSQVQAILLAWLPTKLAPYLSGIMAVDMFITSVIASGTCTLSYILYQFINYLFSINSKYNNSITVQIEYYAIGQYNERKKNIIYEALSWLISQQTKKLEVGSFVLKVVPNMNNKGNDKILPISNIIPEVDNEISIEFKKKKFIIKFKMPEHKNNNNNLSNINSEIISMIAQEKPSIFLTSIKNATNVDDIYDLLNDLTYFYVEFQKKECGRYRYENTRSHWFQIQKLSSCRGLDSIALDEELEILLKKELETFINDRKFYEKLGLPYRRGILLYGKPGTGKTSLINAISSQLSRDIYYLNLKMVDDDSELSSLFSSVPPNQLIVLEDVDAQTKILHKRKDQLLTENCSKENKKDDKKNYFSLSTFLACLDGHILSEGNIIIMTTNHIEHLDPACIRPGRMDVHLKLGYCTQYQIKKLFKRVLTNSDIPENILKKFPDRLLPPCEVMTTLTLYREDKINFVIDKMMELVNKYQENTKLIKIVNTEVTEITEVTNRENKRNSNEQKKRKRKTKKVKYNDNYNKVGTQYIL